VNASPEWSFATLAVDVPHRRWRAAVGALRDAAGCTYFDWLGAVDEAPDGVRVVVRLVALPERPPGVDAVLVRTLLPAGRTRLDSLVPVYAGATWHEREATEMFGLQFVGGGDSAPLLLAEEFEGHPLRKEFVLASRVVTAGPAPRTRPTATPHPAGGVPGRPAYPRATGMPPSRSPGVRDAPVTPPP
jgi:NADH:ubiquinone oxidoreductase subunit C